MFGKIKFQNFIRAALLSATVFVTACTTHFKANVTELKFLAEPTVLEREGEKVRVKGWVRGTVVTDVDVFSLIEDPGHVQTLELTRCEDQTRLSSFPNIYDVGNSPANEYYFIFQYKSWPIDSIDYNLLNDAAELCVQIAAAEMNPFVKIISNKAQFNIPSDLLDEIREYDQTSGEISTVEVIERR